MDLSEFKVGMNVDIQRSDGRVHSACISGINVESESVTVEWFEKGDTKGKEIEVAQVLELNPHLIPELQEQVAPPPPVKSQPISKPRVSSARVPLSNVQHAPATKNGKENRVTSAKSRPSAIIRHAESVDTPPSGPVQNLQNKQQAARRRSNVVKEVDRIKKNREERRAKQAEQIQAKLQDVDASNPNWDFLKMIQEYKADLDYIPISTGDVVLEHQISVCVRKRPLNKKEMGKKELDVLTIPNKGTVLVHEPKLKVDLTKYLENQEFRFDYAFDDNSTNDMVYKFTAKPLVETIFNGGMATCFAYGQTGSGKTHTMGGNFNGKNQDVTKGIYALATSDVFKNMNKAQHKKKDLVASCSFFEIYSGKVFDLLNKKLKLRVLEDGKQQVQVVGLQEKAVFAKDDVLKLIAHGNNVRYNISQSALIQVARSLPNYPKEEIIGKLHGKFSLIDLAGNERGKDTSSSNRQTRMEGAEINKSLLALKECIRSLSYKNAHVPFRASKLTQVLRDSFIGDNAKTCMIAMVSPGMNSCEHTLNTLRYADRVKELGPGSQNDGPNNDYHGQAPKAPSTPDRSLSPSNSDLQMLCTVNEEEVSMEMLTFHEVVNQLQEMEEQVVDDHRNCMQELKQLMKEEESLLQMTDEVDYDVDEYCTGLETLLSKKIELITTLREKVSGFRKQISEEEIASKNIKR